MDLGSQLRAEAFRCQICTGNTDFRTPLQGIPYTKFPPIIGAQGEAQVLFIGINPRRSNTNLKLHEWLMESSDHFDQLAKNHYFDGRAYIASNGPEPHYHSHMIVIEGVFEKGRLFESVAAVTELFLCASEKAPPTFNKSPCADRYLSRVIERVQPKVIIAVGSTVKKHLGQHFQMLTGVPIEQMAHPRNLWGLSYQEKVCRLQPTINKVRKILDKEESK